MKKMAALAIFIDMKAYYKFEVYQGQDQTWCWKKTHISSGKIILSSSQDFTSPRSARKDAEEKGIIAYSEEFMHTITKFEKGNEMVVFTTA